MHRNETWREKQENCMATERTLSNSFNSASLMPPMCSFANVLMSRSPSSVPRFRVWYTSRARSVSSVSPSRGSGVGYGSSGSERSTSTSWAPDEYGASVPERWRGVCGSGKGSPWERARRVVCSVLAGNVARGATDKTVRVMWLSMVGASGLGLPGPIVSLLVNANGGRKEREGISKLDDV